MLRYQGVRGGIIIYYRTETYLYIIYIHRDTGKILIIKMFINLVEMCRCEAGFWNGANVNHEVELANTDTLTCTDFDECASEGQGLISKQSLL